MFDEVNLYMFYRIIENYLIFKSFKLAWGRKILGIFSAAFFFWYVFLNSQKYILLTLWSTYWFKLENIFISNKIYLIIEIS